MTRIAQKRREGRAIPNFVEKAKGGRRPVSGASCIAWITREKKNEERIGMIGTTKTTEKKKGKKKRHPSLAR